MNRNGFLRLMLSVLAFTLVVAVCSSNADACMRGKFRSGKCCQKSCDCADTEATADAVPAPATNDADADCPCKKDCDSGCKRDRRCGKRDRCRGGLLKGRGNGGCGCAKDCDSDDSGEADSGA